MTVIHHKMRPLILAITFVTPVFALSGCMGGPIAQQLVTSLMTRGMDRIANNAYDAQQRDEKTVADRGKMFANTTPDPYYFAFVTSGFENIKPLVESLPTKNDATPDTKIGIATSVAPSAGSPTQNAITSSMAAPAVNPGAAHITRLVRVEIWNLVIGEEKNQILDKARLRGEPLPPKNEWANWKVATGAAENDKKPITFLIPPDMDAIKSGDRAVVEITESNHLYVARYAAN